MQTMRVERDQLAKRSQAHSTKRCVSGAAPGRIARSLQVHYSRVPGTYSRKG